MTSAKRADRQRKGVFSTIVRRLLCWLRGLADHLAKRWTSSDQRQRMPDYMRVVVVVCVCHRRWKNSAVLSSSTELRRKLVRNYYETSEFVLHVLIMRLSVITATAVLITDGSTQGRNFGLKSGVPIQEGNLGTETRLELSGGVRAPQNPVRKRF